MKGDDVVDRCSYNGYGIMDSVPDREDTGKMCRGPRGPVGPRGPQGCRGARGAQGEAATVQAGNVYLLPPGSKAEVVNKGTAENAVFDFYIPLPETVSGVMSEALSTYNDSDQTSSENGPLVFGENKAVEGISISHTENSADINIDKAGLFYIMFNGTGRISGEKELPQDVYVRLYVNNEPTGGAMSVHRYYSVCESHFFGFNTVMSIAANSVLNVVVSSEGYIFKDIDLTVIRIGDA